MGEPSRGEERTKDLRKVVGRLSHRSIIMATYRSSGKGIIDFLNDLFVKGDN